ncbi:MAG: hypothetical protein HXS48_15920 [Theionarchaea archaeon]|nr:hypothetical protein [Theionarchaea archaeon]
MVKASILEVLYTYVNYSTEIGRSTIADFQKKCFPHKKRRTLSRQIKKYEDEIFFGPRLFVLQDVIVKMLKYYGKPALGLLEDEKKDYSVYNSMALVGSYSLISFVRDKRLGGNRNMLTYAESIVPTFPSSKTIEDIDPTTFDKEELPTMRKPLNWDDLDWGIYHKMNNPNEASNNAAKALGVSHKTILTRFYNIQKNCTIWMPFFPKGYDNYNQFVVQFRTEYEIGFRKELQKLDRSSYIYRIDDFLLLHLFLDKNKDLGFVLDLEKKGLIQSLRVSIPLRYHNKSY